MGSDDDSMMGKIKHKASGLLGRDDSVADEDPDIEYEPAPDYKIMADGMVVLDKSQVEDTDDGDGPKED